MNRMNWLRLRRVGFLCGVLGVLGGLASRGLGLEGAWGAELRAGVARVDLTPPLEFQATLGGYGARMSKPATGVHDRVFAKALVLAQGDARLALVTADVLGFPPGFKDAVAASLAKTGWKSQHLMLLPSHSHTSIDMSALHPKNILGIPQIGVFHKKLYERTIACLAEVITAASRDLAPVAVGTRNHRLEGWVRNRRKTSTTTDPMLTVTRIDRTTGDPLAVLVHWAAHPTFMGPEDMMFSGDFPGHVQRTVEALIGRGVTVLYINGAQGDQAPVARPEGGGNWERAERYGRELGIEAFRQWEKIQTAPGAILAAHIEPITLPRHAWHPDFMKTGGAEYGLSEHLVAQFLRLLFPAATHSHSLRLGDLLIVGVPGEMTAELGLLVRTRVREATGVPHVVIGGLADEWISYILSAEQYRQGGYEASVSFYGEGLGEAVVEGAIRGASRAAPRGIPPAAAAPAAPVAQHPFSVHDLVAMQRISEPRVSPDGQWIVFTLRTTDLQENKGRTDLWVVRADGTGLRRLTDHPANDSNPCWSPDGKTIFFLSNRSGSSQVWRVPLDGGQPTQLTQLPLDVANLILSPNGTHMAFTVEVFPGAGIEGTERKLKELASAKSTGRVYDRVFVRHWDTWKDGRRSHLHVLPATGQGEARDVMPQMDADTPSKPFGGPEEFTFTPDGRELVFTARNVGRQEPWSTDFDLYRVPIDGSRPPVCLTEANEAWDSHPCFSPDGTTLAYLAMSRPGYEADRFRIVLRRWPDGPVRVLAEDWDRSPSEIRWSADGKTLYATAWNLGQHSLFAVDTAGGRVRLIVRDGDVQNPAPARTGIVCSRSSLQSPAELFCVPPDGSGLRPITRINAERLGAVRMGEFEQFSFAGFGGETVYGYAVRPAEFDPARKYPVALLIHGGPQSSFGNTFHYRWNPQVYAGAGYAVLMIDFHGSVGYGQAFCDSIRGDWGGKPLEDLRHGLDAALRRYPWMDGDRVAALGASFGGYMINWIAGQWPDRFRCLVNHDGNLDERMAYFDTDELWFPEWDHLGTPWTNPESYEKHNPVRFVGHWRTPMLVIHGAKDYRVVDSQGLGTFNALQRQGIPSRLLWFPDENHWVLAPHNSILWHQTVLGWLDQWLKPTTPPARTSH